MKAFLNSKGEIVGVTYEGEPDDPPKKRTPFQTFVLWIVLIPAIVILIHALSLLAQQIAAV